MEEQPQDREGGDYREPPHEQHNARPVPRIYVASLSDYNDGRLHGAYIDAAQEPDELHQEVRRMLAASPMPGAEEFAVHDYEGFGPLRLEEYEGLETISTVAMGIAEHGPAFAHWAALVGTQNPDALARFEDAHYGHFESVEAYVEELFDDLGVRAQVEESVPEWLRDYVHLDVASFARDMEANGELWTSEGDGGVYVFDPRF
jgi:antirestriction protein